MKQRFHMTTKDKTKFVETLTRGACEHIRQNHQELFKHSRIKHILQAYPNRIPTGMIVEYS